MQQILQGELVNLQNKKNLLTKIQQVLKNRKYNMPNVVTNPKMKDILIENDLCGLDLQDISDTKIIRLLSSDISVFNDEAYRYYLIQFIEQFYLDEGSIFLLMFIQTMFESNQLSKNTKRYLQFQKNEIEVILDFLKFPFENNDLPKETLRAIIFWEQHPNFHSK